MKYKGECVYTKFVKKMNNERNVLQTIKTKTTTKMPSTLQHVAFPSINASRWTHP